MSTYRPWHERSIFLSSTFHDMHAERDAFREIVIPGLAKRLRTERRRHHVREVDLRWGLDTFDIHDQEGKELKVLRFCLDLVRRSKPLMVVLLGDRYGWIPPDDRLRRAAGRQGFRQDVAGKSITHLEIEYGAFNPGLEMEAFFYLRTPLPYDRMTEVERALYSDEHHPDPAVRARAPKLAALRSQITTEIPPTRWRRYSPTWDGETRRVTGLEGWAQQVEEDLWTVLEEETRFVLAETSDGETAESRVLDAFVEDRARGAIGHGAILADCVETLAGLPGRPDVVSVQGEAGSGKSTLFARTLRAVTGTDVVTLPVSIGISPDSARVDGFLKTWIRDLSAQAGRPVPENLDAPASNLPRLFGERLGEVARTRRVALLIDGLDLLPAARGERLFWLPRPLPGNVCLMVTSSNAGVDPALETLGTVWSLTLEGLSPEEGAQCMRAHAERLNKELNPRIVAALSRKRLASGDHPAGNPLWLRTALELLMTLGEEEFLTPGQGGAVNPEQRLLDLLMETVEALPPSLEGLFSTLLAHAERAYGTDPVRFILAYLVCSVDGLGMRELRYLIERHSIAEWVAADVEGLRYLLAGQLAQRGEGERLRLLHREFQEAVRTRYLADSSLEQALHKALADLMGLQSIHDPGANGPVMIHLLAAGNPLDTLRRYAHLHGDAEQGAANEALAAQVIAGMGIGQNPGLDAVSRLFDPDRWFKDVEATSELHQISRDAYDDLMKDAQLANVVDQVCNLLVPRLRGTLPSEDIRRLLGPIRPQLQDRVRNAGSECRCRDASLQYHRLLQALCREDGDEAGELEHREALAGLLEGAPAGPWSGSSHSDLQAERLLEQAEAQWRAGRPEAAREALDAALSDASGGSHGPLFGDAPASARELHAAPKRKVAARHLHAALLVLSFDGDRGLGRAHLERALEVLEDLRGWAPYSVEGVELEVRARACLGRLLDGEDPVSSEDQYARAGSLLQELAMRGQASEQAERLAGKVDAWTVPRGGLFENFFGGIGRQQDWTEELDEWKQVADAVYQARDGLRGLAALGETLLRDGLPPMTPSGPGMRRPAPEPPPPPQPTTDLYSLFSEAAHAEDLDWDRARGKYLQLLSAADASDPWTMAEDGQMFPVAALLRSCSDSFKIRGERDITRQLLERAEELNTRLMEIIPDQPACLMELALNLKDLGCLCDEEGDRQEASRHHHRAIETLETLKGLDPDPTRGISTLLGTLLLAEGAGRHMAGEPGAIPLLERAAQELREQLGAVPEDVDATSRLAEVFDLLVLAQARDDRFDLALEAALQQVPLLEHLWRLDPSDPTRGLNLLMVLGRTGDIAMRVQRTDIGVDHLERASMLSQHPGMFEHLVPESLPSFIMPNDILGHIYMGSGQPELGNQKWKFCLQILAREVSRGGVLPPQMLARYHALQRHFGTG